MQDKKSEVTEPYALLDRSFKRKCSGPRSNCFSFIDAYEAVGIFRRT
jgi:hypothetical protein